MRSLMKVVCVACVVLASGFAMPAMAARSNMISTSYFDASGNFVGQSLWSCENKHFEGGEVTQYVVIQSYGCYIGIPSNGGLRPNSIESLPPPGFTQDELCAKLDALGDYCDPNVAPTFVFD